MRESTEFPIPDHFKGLYRTGLQLAVVLIECGLRVVGPLLSSCAIGLISFVTYSYFFDVLPWLITKHDLALNALLTLLGLWLLGNLLFNYLSCMLVGPGSPPAEMSEACKEALLDDPERRADAPFRYCPKCQVVKSMRSHHCSMCRMCVNKMDHHCPWVNTCVGHDNHRYFLLFLFYLCMAGLFFLSVSLSNVLRVFRHQRSDEGHRMSMSFMLASVLSFSAVIAAGLFLIWNIFLIGTNQTTIEFYGNWVDRTANIYNLGYYRNFEEVFGTDKWYLWLLPSRRPPYGDGVVYPQVIRNNGVGVAFVRHEHSHKAKSLPLAMAVARTPDVMV